MRKNRIAAFDLDGTLVDTATSIRLALNTTFSTFGYQSVTEEDVRLNLGLPVNSLFGHLSVSEIETNRLISDFRVNLQSMLSCRADVYPGIQESLLLLRNSGFELAVATSKPTYLAVKTLENCGLLGSFDLVIGTDNHKFKPDPWILKEVAIRLQGEVLVYIGDRTEDAQAAFNASVPFISVLNSTQVRSDFNQWPHLAICETCLELPETLRIQFRL